MSQLYISSEEVVESLRPSEPVFCVRPHILRKTARAIVEAFPGDVLYAVKCNEHPKILQALFEGGVRHYDTASIAEVRSVRGLMEGAECHYMHPVKSPEAIAEAYHSHGVRSFVLDHPDELDKIMAATDDARDLDLLVRLSTPHKQAILCLSGKFGSEAEEAASLLRSIRAKGCRTGLTFHVGSQCLSPTAFEKAIEMAADVMARSGGPVDILDVGGGFPAAYNGDEPSFGVFAQAIKETCARIGLPPSVKLKCEPGRALVADGMSVVVRVELRRGNSLYLNDGTYGGLAELRFLGACFPMRVIRPGGEAVGEPVGFDLFGPTCDSVDSMPGPHWLPADVKAGDWIEIGQMGAYSNALRTRFNGFDSNNFVTVCGTEESWEEESREGVVVPFKRARSAA